MSQMKAHDLKVVKALSGNDKCCDCGMKHPQWASVSFGNVFCLECSGVHRSLGVHISFVRSIAMDSWTPAQIKIMTAGGNDKCNTFLQSKGVPKTASIKEKYDSDAAALYKEVLKARAEGRPEPTELVKKPLKKKTPMMTSVSSSGGGGMGASASESAGGSNDPNGMERLRGETDEQYIARQTRLREEARKRMAAKFGSGGMNGKRTMGGVGSSPHPSQSGSTALNMDSLGDTLSSGLGTAASGLSSAFSFAKDTVNSTSSRYGAKDVSSMGMGLWNSFSTSAKEVATSLNVDTATMGLGSSGGGDGLSSLQERMKRERSVRSGRVNYSGFGSDSMTGSSNNDSGFMNGNATSTSTTANSTSSGTTRGNNDPNSVAPLEGETNEQYMQRQMRIRNEAKAKLAAGTRVSGVKSSQTPSKRSTPVSKMKVDANDDFFANFGA